MIIKQGGATRRDRDFYPTPIEFCDQAIKQLQPWIAREKRAIRVLDAGAGTGNWGIALKAINPAFVIIGIDLPEVAPVSTYDEWHSDFFEVWCANYTGEPFDLIIGNPPYKNDTPEKWLKMAYLRLLGEQGRIFWLLRLNWFSSQGRFNRLWTQGFMPVSMIQSARRISFTDDGKTDDTDYAMYLWHKPREQYPPYTMLTAFDWQPAEQTGQLALFEVNA